MTNAIALVLAALILGAFALDAFWLHWDLPLILGREFTALVDRLIFWH